MLVDKSIVCTITLKSSNSEILSLFNSEPKPQNVFCMKCKFQVVVEWCYWKKVSAAHDASLYTLFISDNS